MCTSSQAQEWEQLLAAAEERDARLEELRLRVARAGCWEGLGKGGLEIPWAFVYSAQ